MRKKVPNYQIRWPIVQLWAATLSTLLLLAMGQAVLAANYMGLSPADDYPGTPDAKIYDVRYDDGMVIKVAVYNSRGDQVPVGIVAGYGMDFSYLNALAKYLNGEGHPVFLVQPPGQGSGQWRSQKPGDPDGYHNMFEGFGTTYNAGLGKAMHELFGQKVICLYHSRSGYAVRVFMSGLRFEGRYNSNRRPILVARPDELADSANDFLGVAPFFSPIAPKDGLVRLANRLPDHMNKMYRLNNLIARDKQLTRIGAGALGAVASVAVGAWIYPPLVFKAAKKASAGADSIINLIEKFAYYRTVQILTAPGSAGDILTNLDLHSIGLIRSRYPGIYPDTNEELIQELSDLRDVLGDVSPEALLFTLQHAVAQPPTPFAEEEMRNMANQYLEGRGLRLWESFGQDVDGKSFNMIKSLTKVRDQPKPNIILFEAAGDETIEDALREAKIYDKDMAIAKEIPGTHTGGALAPITHQKLGVGINDCAYRLTGRRSR